MMVADNGADWYVSGAPDPRWDDEALGAIRAVKGSDFEVVDSRALLPGADRSPPTTTVAGLPAGWSSVPVTLTFTATDEPGGSGVDYTEYRLDGGAWTRGVALVVPAPPATKATHAVSYRSADKAGNLESARICSVQIDTTTLTLTVTSLTGATGSYPQNSSLPVTWTTSQVVTGGEFAVWAVSPSGWYIGKLVAEQRDHLLRDEPHPHRAPGRRLPDPRRLPARRRQRLLDGLRLKQRLLHGGRPRPRHHRALRHRLLPPEQQPAADLDHEPGALRGPVRRVGEKRERLVRRQARRRQRHNLLLDQRQPRRARPAATTSRSATAPSPAAAPGRSTA